MGYLTELFGDRAVVGRQRLRQGAAAVLPEPPFQRAALAVGGARATKPSPNACGQRPRPARIYDGGSQKTYQQMIEAMDAADRPRPRRARRQPPGATTPSSSSRATTAASASPTPGRSPAARRSCSKAGCASRQSSPGRRAFRRAAPAIRCRSRWTGCRRCWPRPARRPIRSFRRTESTCCRCSPAAAPRAAHALLALQGQRAARDARRRPEVPEDPRQHVPVQRR